MIALTNTDPSIIASLVIGACTLGAAFIAMWTSVRNGRRINTNSGRTIGQHVESIGYRVDHITDVQRESARKMDAHILADASRFEEIKIDLTRLFAQKTEQDAELAAAALIAAAKIANADPDQAKAKIALVTAAELKKAATHGTEGGGK